MAYDAVKALKAELMGSKLPDLLSRYSKRSVIEAALHENLDASDIEMLVVISNYVSWGVSNEIKAQELKSIIHEVTEIKNNLTLVTPGSTVLMRLRNLRAFRPPWFTSPILASILMPLDKEIEQKYGYGVREMFKSIEDLNENPKVFESEYQPGPLRAMWTSMSVDIREVRTFGDLWDKALVRISPRFNIGLQYKLPEVIYRRICRDLLAESNGAFGEKKGKLVEDSIKKELETIFPVRFILGRHFLAVDRKKELDISVIGREFAIAIESKSSSFRNASSDWSMRHALSDLKPIVRGIKQLRPFLDLFSRGGLLIDSDLKEERSVSKNESVVGAVVTDDIYTTTTLDSIYSEAEKDTDALNSIRTYPIRIGSIIDLKYLLTVAQTPSLLIHYIVNFRTKRLSYQLEEADSWYIYSQLPALSDSIRFFEGQYLVGDNIGSGNWWECLRNGIVDQLAPFWILDEMETLIELDRMHSTREAIKIIDKKWIDIRHQKFSQS